VEAAKFNSLYQKRQRLLDEQFFAEKITALVEFVWGIHKQEGQRVSLAPDRAEEIAQLNELSITPAMFDRLRSFREFQTLLNDLDISDEDQLDLFDTLDVDGGGTIDLEELIVGIGKLRGDARRSDIIGVSLITRNIQSTLTHVHDATTILLRDQARLSKTIGDWHRASKHSTICQRNISSMSSRQSDERIPRDTEYNPSTSETNIACPAESPDMSNCTLPPGGKRPHRLNTQELYESEELREFDIDKFSI